MRLRSVSVSFFLTLLIVALPSSAGEKSPLLGKWIVDVTRLEQTDPPASVTLVFAEVGGGSYSLAFDIVTRDGKTIHTGGAFKPDASLISAPGSEELDVATFSMPNRTTLVMGAALHDHPTHTRVWTLSDDGTYMTETIVGHIDGKTPHIRTAIWKRANPG